MSLREKGQAQVKAGHLEGLDVVALTESTVMSSLPHIDNPDQLFGHEPQCECIQKEGEDTEHHLKTGV